MKFLPLAGTCVIELIGKEPASSFSVKTDKYLKIGKIISVGGPEWSEGIYLDIPCRVDEEWVFLSYNDDVDHRTIDGTQYYFVKFGDLRSKITA